ncbi:MAG: RecX family transcriptional regulator [Clostridia bacterium]
MKRLIRKKPPKAVPSAGSPMDAALHFLTHCARTVREVERYLDDCQYGEVEVYETVERLKVLNLLNDREYAEEFVRTRLATKPLSRAHLREQLCLHEIGAEDIDAVLTEVDDEKELFNAGVVIEKYSRQFADLPDEERYERVLKRILSRGYSFDTARAAMERSVAKEIGE